VAVVGAFTGGQAVALKPSLAEPGSFYLDYTLPQGKIQFHYVVDGTARVDPDEATTADGKANERHVERDLFAALNNIMKQRIMVIDGAMGTMIQRHKLQEEDYRSAGEAALCARKRATCAPSEAMLGRMKTAGISEVVHPGLRDSAYAMLIGVLRSVLLGLQGSAVQGPPL
jgi:hypothetical protein